MPSEIDRGFELREGEELGAGLKRVAAGRAERALERLRAGADEGAVHGARKDLKKLRAVLRLARDELPKKLYRDEGKRFREAGRALSASRDAAVKLATLDALVAGEERLPEEASAAWRRILERDREAARDAAGGEERAVELLEAGLAGIRSWPLEGDSWKTLGPAVKRTYRRGRGAMRAVEAEASEEGFHDWRKRAKDLWYALALLAPAWRGPLTVAAEEAHRLTELLGDHHDLAVLREDLRQRRLGEEETRALEAAISSRQERLAREALDLGRRLYAERPQAFARRLRRYWRTWRG